MRRLRRALAIPPLAIVSIAPPQKPLRAEPPAEPHLGVLVRTATLCPELARRMHVAGDVVLLVSILADGTVSDGHIESGHALLRQVAADAVRHWRFTGAPSPSERRTTVAFES